MMKSDDKIFYIETSFNYHRRTSVTMTLHPANRSPYVEIVLPDTQDRFGTTQRSFVIIPLQAIKKLLKGRLD
jgi:hypothetical protein